MAKVQIKDKVQRVPVERIFPNPWNPNEQSEFIYDKEINSIKTFGFLDPILVREIPEGFEIIDGEHRWKAAKQLGLEEIPANNLGKVSDSVAKQLTLITNETRGEARRDKLGELLRSLKNEVGMEELVKNLPYQQVELDSLVDQMQIDWSQVTGPLEGPGSGTDSDPGKSRDSGSGGDAVVGENDEFRDVKFRLPEGVAEQLEQQIERMKRALHPGTDPGDVSPVMAIEAICQHIAQIPDDQLIG